jgi:hypothetical protein
MIEEDILSLNGRRLRLDCPTPPRFPNQPQAAHVHAARQDTSNEARPETSLTPVEERPIHLIRHPSHNPPAFDADEPPPALPLQTPPPHYDMIVGTPSVDGLADYFTRLAAYEGITAASAAAACQAEHAADRSDSDSDSDTNTIGPDTGTGTDTGPTTASTSASTQQSSSCPGNNGPGKDDVDSFSNLRLTTPGEAAVSGSAPADAETVPTTTHQEECARDTAQDDDASSSASDDDEGHARLHRRGRVNVANPRTPGGRLVPSRSLEDLVERPAVRLDMAGVLLQRRGL